MRVPFWMDPWWHQDYEVSSALSVEEARAALAQRRGRFRGRVSSSGGLVLVRHGGFLNQFVRASAKLTSTASGTTVAIKIARPREASVINTIFGVFLILGPVVNVLVVAVTKDLTAATGWLIFVPVGPAIWAAVMGVNYTSVRSEAKDLRAFIAEALSHPPT